MMRVFTALSLTSAKNCVPGLRVTPPCGSTTMLVSSERPSLYFSRVILPSRRGDISPAVNELSAGADRAISTSIQ